uniref:Replication factor A C-terminal domain-containing protein n=1 Tax=Tanacetum cinerariifolium TaxID=118510 RepID=A0A699IH07_TANCI|nr:hypothetical protein [Tanacetum cinerariifolium]
MAMIVILCNRGQSLRVTLWGELGDVLVKDKARRSLCHGLNWNVWKGPCCAQQGPLSIDCSQPREGTLKNLLIWARNRQNNTATFHCKVMIENFRAKKGWNYPSCGYEKCRKGATRKLGKWVCEACNRTVDYPVFRYKLEVVVADDTAHIVVVMFNDTATKLLKCSTESLMGTEDENSDAEDQLNLPVAIRNVIGTDHVLEIKSHTYYEYGSFESFNYWKIIPNASAEDGASSSTTAMTANDVESSMKIVTKPPTVCTPLKPNEKKKQKGSNEIVTPLTDPEIEQLAIKDDLALSFIMSSGFPAQSVRSSNAIALDSSYLLVLITKTSQSRQHGKSESDSYYLSD